MAASVVSVAAALAHASGGLDMYHGTIKDGVAQFEERLLEVLQRRDLDCFGFIEWLVPWRTKRPEGPGGNLPTAAKAHSLPDGSDDIGH